MEADTRHILSMSFQCLYACFILQKVTRTGTDNKHIATLKHSFVKKKKKNIQNLPENIFSRVFPVTFPPALDILQNYNHAELTSLLQKKVFISLDIVVSLYFLMGFFFKKKIKKNPLSLSSVTQ